MSGLAAALVRRRPRSLPALSARLRRRLLVLALACLALAAGYQLWLRDSSLVAVERVHVSGLSTSDAERVRMALTAAARSMTTLHVDPERLERAVAAYPVVHELEITTDFPHGLAVHVVEHEPAAMAVADGARVPVAGDGTVLRGLPVEARLPTIEVDGVLGGDALRDADARSAAAVAGAAPGVLRRRVESVEQRAEEGLVAELRDGPELIFGDARRARAKWAAAARVLADPAARGASYIDLRIPGRPAAGGLPAETLAPVAPAGMDPTTTIPPVDAGAAVAPPAGTAPGVTGTPAPTTPTAPPATTAPPASGQAPAAPPTTPPQPAPTTSSGGGATAAP